MVVCDVELRGFGGSFLPHRWTNKWTGRERAGGVNQGHRLSIQVNWKTTRWNRIAGGKEEPFMSLGVCERHRET